MSAEGGNGRHHFENFEEVEPFLYDIGIDSWSYEERRALRGAAQMVIRMEEQSRRNQQQLRRTLAIAAVAISLLGFVSPLISNALFSHTSQVIYQPAPATTPRPPTATPTIGGQDG